MFSESAQLLIPGVIFVIVYVTISTNNGAYDFFYVAAPLVVVAGLMYIVVILFFTGTKYGFIVDPPEYVCPAGKVKFYNAGNVLCFDGEMAKEIRR